MEKNTFTLVYCYDDQGEGAMFSDYKVRKPVFESSSFNDCETAHETAIQYETETIASAWIVEALEDGGFTYTKIA